MVGLSHRVADAGGLFRRGRRFSSRLGGRFGGGSHRSPGARGRMPIAARGVSEVEVEVEVARTVTNQ